MNSLAQQAGLAFIPMLSPAPARRVQATTIMCVTSTPLRKGAFFSEPDLSKESHAPEQNFFLPLRSSTSISKSLKPPVPPSKITTKHPETSGRVLTSIENIKQMDIKQKEKEETARIKEEKRKLREEKRRLKQQEKQKNSKKKKSCKK